MLNATSGQNGTTGINHWWTYEERPIPGVGQAMVNVGTGNLVIASTDVSIHEVGIDLVFRRVYNSQSQHDVNADDGGDKALYGNNWTNTFDANMVYNKTTNTITVYDIDGTQCAYTATTDTTNYPTGWKPCAGEHAILGPTDANDCTYAWTKNNGTVYWFHADNNGGTNCNIAQARKGHLQEILARNNNNNITFAYSFVPGYNGAEYVTEIDANYNYAGAGTNDSLKMYFGTPNSTCTPGTAGCWNLLGSVVRSGDNATANYSYDATGNLLEVDKPGNDAATNSANAATLAANGVIAGDLPETYHYYSGTSNLYWVCGPRCTIANWKSSTAPLDGAKLYIGYDSATRVNAWHEDGVVNFAPADGTSPSQNLSDAAGIGSAWNRFYVAWFYYDSATPTNCRVTPPPTPGLSPPTNAMCDGDDHEAFWYVPADNTYRVTQTQDFAEGATFVPSWEWWDANNNLYQTKDARLNITKYAYDGDGNTVEMQAPSTSDIVGAPSPLSTYSYDTLTLKNADGTTAVTKHINIVAYCDPNYNASHGKLWAATPTDTLCNVGSGATVYAYAYPGREPYGCLTDATTPLGYHRAFGYGSYCGNGLPTTVQGDFQGQPISQYDGSTRTPTQTFVYDTSTGNLTSYSRGNGNWTFDYDNVNRLRAVIDPETVYSYTCYNSDDSVAAKETALQHSTFDKRSQIDLTCGNNSEQFGHDSDGDVISDTRHYNGANTTLKWYDGFDRLVEVELPSDGNIVEGNAFTRYVYDMTESGEASDPSLVIKANGSNVTPAFVAHGNLFKTQERLAGNWSDVNGNAFDALDRSIARYQWAPPSAGNPASLGTTTNTYDTYGNRGLLGTTVDAVGNTTTFVYDEQNRVSSKTYTGGDGDQPRKYEYDADGHQLQVTFTGSQWTDTWSYDADGRVQSYAEGNGGNTTQPATVKYGYYADGLRSSLSITGTTGISFGNPVFQYAYQPDGARSLLKVAGYVNPFSWTYDRADRMKTQKDPFTQSAFTWGQYASGILNQKSMTYDPTTGEMATLKFPDGAQYGSTSPMSYDPEGDITGFSVSAPSGWNPPGDTDPQSYVNAVRMSYDVRGELAYMAGTSPARAGYPNPYETVEQNKYDHGHPCNQVNPNLPTATQAPPCAVDAKTGSGLQNLPLATKTCSYGGTMQFDGAGRIIENDIAEQGDTNLGCNVQPSPQPAERRKYDAENHTVDDNCLNPTLLVANQCSQANVDYTYGWGPNGKARTHTGTSNLTLHWDGDELLFVTDGSGNLKELFVEKLGSIVTNTSGTYFSIADRDFAGMAVGSHGENGSGGIVGSGPNALPSHGLNLHPKFSDLSDYGGAGAGYWVGMKRNDGYQVGPLTIQGVRAYDAGAGQWSTPDAYKGEVHDPMSQKAYMWNGNNPIRYEDPSGYEIGAAFHNEDAMLCGGQCNYGPGVLPAGSNVTVNVGGSVSTGNKSVGVQVTISNAPALAASFTSTVGVSAPGLAAQGSLGFVQATAPGKTTKDVIMGGSVGGSGGHVAQFEYLKNSSGYHVTTGLTSSPNIGAAGSYGFYYIGSPGSSAPVKGATPPNSQKKE